MAMAANGNASAGPISGEHVAGLRVRGTASNGAFLPSPPVTPKVNNSALPKPAHYDPKGSIPNTPLTVSVISASLGALAGLCVYAVSGPVFEYTGATEWAWVKPQLGIYFTAMAVFHLLEYWTTAGWNPEKLSVDGESTRNKLTAAFLLNNGHEYHIAHGFGLAEYLVSSYLWPSKYDTSLASFPALAICTLKLLTLANTSHRSDCGRTSIPLSCYGTRSQELLSYRQDGQAR